LHEVWCEKVSIPNRGAKGGNTLEEGVVLVSSWKAQLQACPDVDDNVKTKYLTLMDVAPASATTSTIGMAKQDVQQLVHAGFLTNPSALANATPTGLSSLLEVSKAGQRAPSGSLAAIGGAGALHESGGSGSVLTSNAPSHRLPSTVSRGGGEMTFSLPHTGPYLKLLTSARQHLLGLLKALSPRWREATVDMLKEKWEGNVLGDAASVQKRARGEWNGVLTHDFIDRRWRMVLDSLGVTLWSAVRLLQPASNMPQTWTRGPSLRFLHFIHHLTQRPRLTAALPDMPVRARDTPPRRRLFDRVFVYAFVSRRHQAISILTRQAKRWFRRRVDVDVDVLLPRNRIRDLHVETHHAGFGPDWGWRVPTGLKRARSEALVVGDHLGGGDEETVMLHWRNGSSYIILVGRSSSFEVCDGDDVGQV